VNSRTIPAVVIGDGVIGLSTAYELARAGVSCCLVGARREGAASGAAAGLIAPSIGQLREDVAGFFTASRDLYPALLDSLREFDPELRLLTGLIELPSANTAAPSKNLAPNCTALRPSDLAVLEPSLDTSRGGLLHERDGAIDNVRLVAAFRRALAREKHAQFVEDDLVTRVDVQSSGGTVTLRSGRRLNADNVVLAAGAWSQLIDGLPRRLPIAPLKGQMLALDSQALQHPVMGEEIYLVPRGQELAIGATVEDAGFDLSTTSEAIEGLRLAAVRLVPSLEHARVSRRWAGLRPATPDRLPILGPDPEHPRLIYACGHTKNGILLAPGTAQALTALITRNHRRGLEPFSIERFG